LTFAHVLDHLFTFLEGCLIVILQLLTERHILLLDGQLILVV